MSAISQAQRIYAPASEVTRTPRSAEYEVIARITRRLKQAIEARGFRQLVDALHENRKLWSTLAINVAAADNALPADLRARLFYLAEFTDTHTQKVLRKEANASVLLEINISILRGLKMEGARK